VTKNRFTLRHRVFARFTVCVAIAAAVPAAAQHNTAQAARYSHSTVAGKALERSVDAYVRDEMTKRRIPGLALAVIRRGRIEKVTSYGYANAEFSVPVTSGTLFQVASITKEFTSVGVLELVEAGKLKLDDRIGAYLYNLPAKWQDVTIRQLLNHTSGLPDIINKTSESLADTPDEALQLLWDKPLDFATGSQWAYNQTNYMLLQLLIEKVSGLSFERFCEARLFAPLQLSSPTFGGQVIIKQRASLYTAVVVGADPPKVLDRPEIYNAKMIPMLYSAGGLNISIEDFAHWIVALLEGKLIGKTSLEALWTSARLSDGHTFDSYGMGWWLSLQSPHPAVGGNGGGRASFFYYQKDGLVVIVLTNLLGSNPESLVDGIAHQYLNPWDRVTPQGSLDRADNRN